MKTINRFLTALLAAAMVLSLSAPALAVSESIRQKYRYNFDSDPLGIFLHEKKGYSSAAIAAIAEGYEADEDTEQYLYALAKAGIITIFIQSGNQFAIYAGASYPDGNGSVSVAAGEKRVKDYPDVAPEAWYYDAVMEVSKGALMSGDDLGLFRPDDKTTVAEFTAILCRVYNLPIHVFGGPWYGPYIDALIAAGMDFGSCKYEQALENITRGEAIEAMTVMLRARGGEPKRSLTWADVQDAEACIAVPEQHSWNAQALLDALNYGVIDGANASHRVNAADSLTRAELCRMLFNIGVTSAQSVDAYKAHEVHRQYTGR